MKAAETDATKRALATFGNLFGLALYDPEQRGVRKTKKAQDIPASWTLRAASAASEATFERRANSRQRSIRR